MMSHSSIAASQFLLEMTFWFCLPVALSLHTSGKIKHQLEGQSGYAEDICYS